MLQDYAGIMTNPAAILWDMDGTLVDTEPYWIEAEIELMRAHGLDWTKEQGLQFVGNDLLTSAGILRAAGLDLAPETIVETLLEKVIERVRVAVPFRPGALEFLAAARAEGIPCLLVTASYRSLAEAVVASCPAGSFDGIVAGDEVSAGKPAPEPYLKAAAMLGLDPGDCVAFEDSVPGLTSAEAAGTIAVGIPHLVELEPIPGRHLWPSLAGRTIADLRGLRSRLSV